MATGEAKRITTAFIKQPIFYEPKFTSERWSDGIFNVEHNQVNPSLYIGEDELLSFSQREERETRSLLFLYQIHYAEAEYKLMQEEFRNIEEKLNRQVLANEQNASFKKPIPPVKNPPRKKAGKKKSTPKTSSGSEASDTPQEKTQPRPKLNRAAKSGMEKDERSVSK